MLTQTTKELTKQLSKFPQKLKEMQKVPNKHQQVAYCELCNGDHPKGNINATLVIKEETLKLWSGVEARHKTIQQTNSVCELQPESSSIR